jgi:beta-ureidopropionase / N-carbamoyl-L-amino-acid hydrolase
MRRRTLVLAGLAAGLSLSVAAGPRQSMDSLEVNAARLGKRLEELGRIGRNAQGGIDRPAFGEADIQAREYVKGLMGEMGLEVRVDAAGNIIGREATGLGLAPLILGSHVDSVLNGGMYDGALGVLAALECLQVLRESALARRNPIEVVVFADEEGGSIGSKAMIGELPAPALEAPGPSGRSVREGIKAIGGDPDRLSQASRKGERIKAYLELHIEQGGKLEARKAAIGIVEGIVGIRRYEAVVEGVSNHAGTTPMEGRKDALIAASQLVLAVNRVVTGMSGTQVGTVGKLSVEPNVPNVIPGHVVMTVEIRDLSEGIISNLYGRIVREAGTIEKATGTKISFAPVPPPSVAAPTDPGVRQLIADAAMSLGLSKMMLPSGAGHDAQNMARLAPMGMIFIPSRGGVSHSPKESSSPEDVANGANVLLQTVIRIERGGF